MADNNKHTYFMVSKETQLTVDGVKSVDSFDSNFLSIELNEGALSVEGEELKIENLSQDSGEMIVSGKIRGVFYNSAKKKRPFWGLFG